MLPIILIMLGAAMITALFMGHKRLVRLTAELEDFRSGAVLYEAEVLNVSEENIKLPDGKRRKRRTMNIKFRIEEQKKTVIHRCTGGFYGKYKAGDRIKVYFMEGMPADRAMPAEDNLPERFARVYGLIKLPAAAAAVILTAAGIILML